MKCAFRFPQFADLSRLLHWTASPSVITLCLVSNVEMSWLQSGKGIISSDPQIHGCIFKIRIAHAVVGGLPSGQADLELSG